MPLLTESAAATATEVTIAVGEARRTYRLFETTAPDAYDGFGTVTYYRGDGSRFVLVDVRHAEWQAQRYASGMQAVLPSDLFPADGIAETLWALLMQGIARHANA